MSKNEMIKEVSKTRPCPLCGKPDYCGFMTGSDGREIVVCKRTHEPQPVVGLDGFTYVCVGKTEISYLFMEASLKAERDAERGFTAGMVSGAKRYVPKQMTVVDEIVPLSHDQLDTIYRYLLGNMILDDMHREWLIREGWSNELIEKNLIKTMPLDDYKRFKRRNYYSKSPWRKSIARCCAEHFGSLKGVPGFYKGTDVSGNDVWRINARSGIVFPLYDLDGRIYALRIRMDFLDAAVNVVAVNNELRFTGESGEEKYITPLKGIYTLVDGQKVYEKAGGKYRPLTSFSENEEEYRKGFIVNNFRGGCRAEPGFGFYKSHGDNNYCLYITEGEKKGILGNALLGAPFISLPGVGSIKLLFNHYRSRKVVDWLKDMGVKVIIVAFDADKAYNTVVLANQEKIVAALKKEGFMLATAEWDINIGKGIDDLLAAGQKPGFQLVD